MKPVRAALWILAVLASAAALMAERRISSYSRSPYYEEMVRAARLMEEAEARVRDARTAAGIGIDPLRDPNSTGLVGVEYSETTTSLGDLESKRTSAGPDMAALSVLLLREAGVKSGDAIAVGASGSFPGLVLAVLSAARALDLDVALVSSLGASSWGANIPEFSYLRIHEAALPVLGYPILAVSLGGGEDAGGDMQPEGRRILSREAFRSGLRVINARSLEDSVDERLALYDSFLGGRACAAFVNVGGASANIGEDDRALELLPGINPPKSLSPEGRGTAFAMSARGVPVIHLLNLRALARDYGLPWDPVPFPGIGESRVYKVYDRSLYRRRLGILSALYFAALAALGAAGTAARRGPRV
ncbi:MAG: poly-gamma-glutamate system protein [Treponema sp.]|nr:poly-gamma-glutamate system protein [Treponema sp.]